MDLHLIKARIRVPTLWLFAMNVTYRRFLFDNFRFDIIRDYTLFPEY